MSVKRATAAAERYWALLSLIRFELAISIVLSHVCLYRRIDLQTFGVGGVPAVLGFFLISGFSIAHSLRQSPQGYMRRRLVRILPLSIFSVLFSLLIWRLLPDMPPITIVHMPLPDWFAIVSTLFLMNGILCPTPILFGPTWSLNCEMVYYVTVPTLKRFPKTILFTGGCISLIFFEVHIRTWDITWLDKGRSAFALAWIWMLGFYTYGRKLSYTGVITLALGCIFLTYRLEEASLSALICGIAVPWTAIATFGEIAIPKKLAYMANYLGELSYPIYLLHSPILLVVKAYFDMSKLTVFTITSLLLTFTFAMIIYHLIDRPMRHYLLRHR